MMQYNFLGIYGMIGDAPMPLRGGSKEEIRNGEAVASSSLEDLTFSLDPMIRQLPFTTAHDLRVQVAIKLDNDNKGNQVVREVFIQPAQGDKFSGLEEQVKGITRPHELMGLEKPLSWTAETTEDEVTDHFAVFTQSGTKYTIAANPFNYELLDEDPLDREMLFRHLACLNVETDNGRKVSAHWEEGNILVFPDYSRITKVAQYGCIPYAINGPCIQFRLFDAPCIVDIETPDWHYQDYDVLNRQSFGNAYTEPVEKDRKNLAIGTFQSLPFNFLEYDDNRWRLIFRTRTDDSGEYVSHIEAEPSRAVDLMRDDIKGVELLQETRHQYHGAGDLKLKHGKTLYVIKKVKLL